MMQQSSKTKTEVILSAASSAYCEGIGSKQNCIHRIGFKS